MFSLIRYVMVFVVGSGLGYWFAATQELPTAIPQIAAPPTVIAPTTTITPSDDHPQTAVAPPQQPLTRPADPFEVIHRAELNQAPADTAWLDYLQQHYDAPTQQMLNIQSLKTRQLIHDFHQTEVDPHWANLTEQRLRDFYFLQPDQQFIQINKVHCRQHGCEISGFITKPDLGPVLHDHLRQQSWAKGRSMSFSTNIGDGKTEKFYLLMTELPKE